MAEAKASGKMYSTMIAKGMSTAHLMFGGDTQQTLDAYNQEYARVASQMAAQSAMGAAQKNVAKVKQNVILSNSKIQMQQDQAEAQIKVSAAQAGAAGSSVESAKYSTRANESYAMGAAQAAGDAKEDQYLAQVHEANLAMNSAVNAKKDHGIHVGEALMGAVAGGFNDVDFKNIATMAEEKNWFGTDTTEDELPVGPIEAAFNK
jgi:hypothetical protein